MADITYYQSLRMMAVMNSIKLDNEVANRLYAGAGITIEYRCLSCHTVMARKVNDEYDLMRVLLDGGHHGCLYCPLTEDEIEGRRILAKYLSFEGHTDGFDLFLKEITASDYESYLRYYLTEMPYKEFLRTLYWKSVATEVKRRFGNKCQLCASTKHIQAHHRSYDHHGEEHNHLEDLTVLCANCHGKFHGHA